MSIKLTYIKFASVNFIIKKRDCENLIDYFSI